jgi:hypothetical protein
VPELPASVRVAVWTTHVWNVGGATSEALDRALPDVDHVDGDLATLDAWHALGEHAVLVALPSPGHLAGLPRAGAEAVDDAVDAGECIIAPSLGGIIVPVVRTFGTGSGADSGTRVDLVAHDAEPLPHHVVAALDGSALERHLREHLVEATEALDDVGGRPFSSRLARDAAEAALGGDWGLPDGLPPRLSRVLALAATTSRIAAVALDQPEDGLDAGTMVRRRDLLQRLHRVSETTVADAANATCAALAGWAPSMR